MNQRCLSVATRPECVEDIAMSDFSVSLSYIVEECQALTDFSNFQSITTTIMSPFGVCIPVDAMSMTNFCYTATLMYRNITVMSQTNLEFHGCKVSTLQNQLMSGVTLTLSSTPDNSGTVPHATIATLGCSNAALMVSEDPEVLCRDGVWDLNENVTCSGMWHRI